MRMSGNQLVRFDKRKLLSKRSPVSCTRSSRNQRCLRSFVIQDEGSEGIFDDICPEQEDVARQVLAEEVGEIGGRRTERQTASRFDRLQPEHPEPAQVRAGSLGPGGGQLRGDDGSRERVPGPGGRPARGCGASPEGPNGSECNGGGG